MTSARPFWPGLGPGSPLMSYHCTCRVGCGYTTLAWITASICLVHLDDPGVTHIMLLSVQQRTFDVKPQSRRGQTVSDSHRTAVARLVRRPAA